jgi:ketosteroid isomerase-like protein
LETERNKEIVKRNFQLVSEGDVAGAAALYAPISTNHGRKVERKDIALVLESVVALQERFTVHEVVAEGEWVACRATVTGKHVTQPRIPVDGGIYAVAEPTGRAYTFQHIHLFRIVGGQIVEHWANRDDLGAARQLGLELGPAKSKKANE